MAFDPFKSCDKVLLFANLHRFVQSFHVDEVADRLLLCSVTEPTVFLPSEHPFGDNVQHILGVQLNVHTGVGEGVENRKQA
ncbi:hypothetical protein D3C84_1155120 [compost metagenome]